MGGAAEGATGWAFAGFNFIIYTIGFGMPGTLVGLAVFSSIILDAISDPLVGYVSDRWRSAWGRRHPFIYAASIPLGICVFCIYAPPDALLASGGEVISFLGYEATGAQWLLTGWLFVFASLLKFFMTCYHLPHLALGSELTDDYLERTRIFRYNTLFSMGGGAVLAYLFYNFFFPQGPQPDMDTTFFAACVAIFGSLVIFLTAFLTREQIPLLPKAQQEQEPFSLGLFFREAAVVFRNKNYLMLFFGLFCLSPMIGVRETLNANMTLYYWELEPALIGLFPTFAMASYLVGMSLVVYFNSRFEKGGTMRVAVGMAALAASAPVILRSIGWFPDNNSAFVFPILGIGVFVYYGGLAILTTSVYSAIGDVVDEHELETGNRQEGIFYAVRTFFSKLTNALGHLLAGIAIDVIGFPAKAVVGEVDQQVLFEMGLFEGVLSVLPVIGAIYFYGRYKIDKTRHQEILQALDDKRAGAEPT